MRRLWKEQTPDLVGYRSALYQRKGTVKVKSIEAAMPRQWQRSCTRNRGAHPRRIKNVALLTSSQSPSIECIRYHTTNPWLTIQ
jgi:hypothetical protein